LLVAVDGAREQVEKESKIIERILKENGGFDILRSRNKEEEDKLWDVRRAISPSLDEIRHAENQRRCRRPALARSRTRRQVEEIGRKHDTFVANFGHAGDGNIHVNFVCATATTPIRSPARAMRQRNFCFRSNSAARSPANTASATSKPLISIWRLTADARSYESIKRVFDPNGILNPGKMFV
jgi:glycolate oxidase